MWSLIVFTFATRGAASATVATLEFSTEQLCLIAAREPSANGTDHFILRLRGSGGTYTYENLDGHTRRRQIQGR